ncbi:MAG: ATP-grasp domain-containing protein [Candidatus Bathyarchaeota archaeon]|nr:ATP-grasp domain-containing protein [Candidatus Bathyarchaeota archaeon]
MIENDIHNILVIGMDVVSLATSATKAGYKVYTVDYFGDQDLKRVCHESLSIVKQTLGVTCGQLSTNFSPEALLQLTMGLLKKNTIDVTLLSTGLDDSPDVLFELNDMIPILGNRPHVIKRIRDKMKFFQELERLEIPHPETAMAENFEEARKKAKDIGYPVLVKPSKGFGGVGIRKAQGPKELKQAFQHASLIDEKVLIQEYISGTPASVSLISSNNETITLTLNEQLLGVNELGQEEPFGYCGNVVPLVTTRSVMNRCKNTAERITSHFGLIGSNGIDFVISKEGIPYVVEVNPRFQATLECVERVLGINMVEAHMKACLQGILPIIVKKTAVFCTRLILFAPQRSIIPDFSVFEEVRDIPIPEVIIEKGEPVCSIVREGADRNSSLRKARIIAESICKSLQPRR